MHGGGPYPKSEINVKTTRNHKEPFMKSCPFCDSTSLKKIAFSWVQCRDCGLGFNPAGYAPTNVAKSEEDRQAVWQDSVKKLNLDGLKKIETLLGHKGKLLDLGCGHGNFMKMAIEHGWEAEGIEVSEPAIRQARDVFKLKVYDKPLEFLSIPDRTYDAVTLWRVLDLLPEPRKELERIHRVLKPGGVVWIRINNFDFHYTAFRIGELPLLKGNVHPGVVHRYGVNARALRKVFEKTGFNDINIMNSELTSGDPYSSGGKMGALIVVLTKKVLFAFWQLMAAVSGNRILWSSSLKGWARRPL
jgi:ubiquinone/menaquinone biosynthesis C-methylase UbiE